MADFCLDKVRKAKMSKIDLNENRRKTANVFNITLADIQKFLKKYQNYENSLTRAFSK